MWASSWRRWLASVLAVGTLGCAANPAPRGWLAPAREAQADPYGAWIVVWRIGGGSDVAGEFLAVERDTVFVLAADGAVRTVPVGSVLRAEIAFYDAPLGEVRRVDRGASWDSVRMYARFPGGLPEESTAATADQAATLTTDARQPAPRPSGPCPAAPDD